MSTNSNEKLVLSGIWTPSARVICYKCHGKVFPNAKYNKTTKKTEDLILTEEQFQKACTPQPLEENYEITVCEQCGKEIQVFYDIAYENNFCNRLRENNINAYMYQTGGMNSAIWIRTKDEGYALIVYDITGDEDWLMDFYDKDDEYIDKTYITKTEDEMLDYILKLDCLV